MDSDDVWFEDKLQKQIHFMQEKGCDLSYTAYSFIKPNDGPSRTERVYNVPENITYEKLLKENVIGCSTVMINAAALKGHEFNKAFAHEDYALWLDLAKSGKLCVVSMKFLQAMPMAEDRQTNSKPLRIAGLSIDSLRIFQLLKHHIICFYTINAIKKYKMLVD